MLIRSSLSSWVHCYRSPTGKGSQTSASGWTALNVWWLFKYNRTRHRSRWGSGLRLGGWRVPWLQRDVTIPASFKTQPAWKHLETCRGTQTRNPQNRWEVEKRKRKQPTGRHRLDKPCSQPSTQTNIAAYMADTQGRKDTTTKMEEKGVPELLAPL